MKDQLPAGRIFISGTMRGGSSVTSNVLNAHSKILVMGEYVHFFRFIYKHYDPLNRNNVERMLKEMHARLYWRYKVEVEVEDILEDIASVGYTYKNVYDAIMRYYLIKFGKSICGEDAALEWRNIPEFLSIFPDAKVIHVCRDPRSIVASWSKASYHEIDNLVTIFNCIDALDKCIYYKKILPKKNFYYFRYEDLIRKPEVEVSKLCNFLEIEQEPLMLQPEKWDDVFDGVYVKRGWSSHVGVMTKGFDISRVDAWKQSLEDWKLCLCECLAKERLEEFGYELSGRKFDVDTIYKGINTLRNSNLLYKCLSVWLSQNQGFQGPPSDPRDPRTWGMGSKGKKKKFVDSEDGKTYLKVISEIRKSYDDDNNI